MIIIIVLLCLVSYFISDNYYNVNTWYKSSKLWLLNSCNFLLFFCILYFVTSLYVAVSWKLYYVESEIDVL